MRRIKLAAFTFALAIAVGVSALPALAQRVGAIRPVRLEFEGRPILHGVCYGPHRDGQSPGGAQPSAEELLEDLRILARHWRLFRMYDASPSAATCLRLIREHRLPLHLILGVWITPEDTEAGRAGNRARVAAAIALAREFPDLVVAVNIGNETQVDWSGHRCEPAALIRHLRDTRAAIAQPVTTADDFKFWATDASRRIAAECDFLMLHAYPLWNGQPLDGAVAWTARTYDNTRRLHADLPIILAEAGWATSHDAARRGPSGEGTLIRAETSPAAQHTHLRELRRWSESRRVTTLIFEAFDEPWKGRGPAGSPAEAEKNWGLLDTHRRPKPALTALAEEFLRPSLNPTAPPARAP